MILDLFVGELKINEFYFGEYLKYDYVHFKL